MKLATDLESTSYVTGRAYSHNWLVDFLRIAAGGEGIEPLNITTEQQFMHEIREVSIHLSCFSGFKFKN